MRVVEYFVSGTNARTAAALVGVNKSTAAYYFHRLREIIAQAIREEMPLAGEIEVNESYFGVRRKGKRGRGAAGKVPVFVILKGGARVCESDHGYESQDVDGHFARADYSR